MSDEILTLDDIAHMYKVTRERARDTIVKQPGFPPIAPGSTWRLPRWVGVEVRAYIRREYAEIQTKRPPNLIAKSDA